MSRTYRYLHLDVFTRERFAGNQLAVLLDARGLDPADMQRVAREFNFSETTFVLPAEAPGTDKRVRIFTPGQELPMAGHPTVGTAFALAHEGTLVPDQSLVTFGLGVGPTPVSLEWVDGRLEFAWMTQQVPVFGPEIPEVAPLADALGVELTDIVDTGLPVVEASAGVPFLYVPLASREAVDGASADSSGLIHFFQGAGLRDLPVFVFTLEKSDDDATVYSRMFAPIFGIPEDPATGSATGPLGAYLVRHGAVSAERAGNLLSLQGAAMGRPSRIHIAVDVADGQVTGVRIGGQAVVVASGEFSVPA
jgi:trans-2,3-dihydro-3-hydroxyanthranilate isomerase